VSGARSLSLVLALALAGPAFAKAPEGAPRAQARWQELTARSGAPAAATWNAQTGSLRSAYGVLSEPRADVSERSAREFLEANAELLGLDADTGNLVLARTLDSPLGRHFRFEQRLLGLPVDGAVVAVHFDRQGRVVALNNAYRPGLVLESAEPAVPVAEAVERLGAVGPALPGQGPEGQAARAERLKMAQAFARGTLLVWAMDGKAHLAWRVDMPSAKESWRAVVDARSGAVLQPAHDINRYADGTGRVFKVNAVVSTHDNSLTDQNDSADAVPASAYAIVTLPALDDSGFLDGQYASSRRTKKRAFSASNTFLFDHSNDGFSETMGYYAFDYAERYIQSLGFANVNTVGAQQSGGFQDECIAEWDATFYAPGVPHCLRRLDGTKHYPESIAGEVHRDGEIWSAALWQIRGAIGATRADKLVLQHHFLIGTDPSFNEAANALVTAAQGLGYTNNLINAIRTILRNRGFTVTV